MHVVLFTYDHYMHVASVEFLIIDLSLQASLHACSTLVVGHVATTRHNHNYMPCYKRCSSVEWVVDRYLNRVPPHTVSSRIVDGLERFERTTLWARRPGWVGPLSSTPRCPRIGGCARWHFTCCSPRETWRRCWSIARPFEATWLRHTCCA